MGCKKAAAGANAGGKGAVAGAAKPARGVAAFFSAHRYFFLFFCGSLLYHMTVSACFGAKYGTDGISFTLHVINYDFGFCSKLLPGEIFTLLCPNPTKAAITVYESALLLLVMTAVCAMLEKLMLTVPQADKKNVLYLIALYLLGTATFSMLFQELGLLDAYWFYISVLLVPCLRHRVLRFLLPVFFVLTVMIHFAAVVSYIPLFSLLLLYEMSLCRDRKERAVFAVIFAVCVLLAVSGSVDFMLNERKNLVYPDVASFNDALTARGADYYVYFDYTFYDDYTFLPDSSLPSFLLSGTGLPVFLEQAVNKVLMQVYYCYLIHKDLGFVMLYVHFALFLLLLPVYVSFYRVLIGVRKACADRLGRFALFCALFLSPLTYVSGVLFSTDPRWACHAYITLFTFLLYVLYRSGDDVRPVLAREMGRFSPALRAAYLLIYGVIVIEPYI